MSLSSKINSTIQVAALGAGSMFLLDPERGASRRAYLRDQLLTLRDTWNDLAEKGPRMFATTTLNRLRNFDTGQRPVEADWAHMATPAKSSAWPPVVQLAAMSGSVLLFVRGLQRGGVLGLAQWLTGLLVAMNTITQHQRRDGELILLEPEEMPVAVAGS